MLPPVPHRSIKAAGRTDFGANEFFNTPAGGAARPTTVRQPPPQQPERATAPTAKRRKKDAITAAAAVTCDNLTAMFGISLCEVGWPLAQAAGDNILQVMIVSSLSSDTSCQQLSSLF